MTVVTVVISPACTACGSCLSTCPEGSLSAHPGRPDVDSSTCTGCLACVEVCPTDAITWVGSVNGAGSPVGAGSPLGAGQPGRRR